MNRVSSVVSKFPRYTGLKITGIQVFQVDLPLHAQSYNWSGGNTISTFDATVVRIETNREGVVGYGEVTPLGPNYLPSYAEVLL